MINKVMYIKYEGTKRTTIAANTDGQGLVLKMDTVEPIVTPVVEAVDEQAYMDMLTERMFEKIRLNKIKINKRGR